MNDLPAVGATISSQQFNQMNTAAAPLPTGASSALPPIGSTVNADQFKTFQPAAPTLTGTSTGQGFNQANDTMNEASKGYASGLLKTYAGAVGLNSETGQWEMPDFLKEAQSGQSKATDMVTGPDGKPQQLGEFSAWSRNVASGALRSGASLINLVFAPITQAVSSLAEASSNNPNVQKAANGALSKLADAGKAIQDLRDSHPEESKNIDSILAFVLTAGGGEGLNTDLSDVFTKPEKFSGPTKEPPAPPTEPPKVTLKSGATTDAATAEALGKVANEWRSPTEQNVAGYKIPTGILEKSPEIPDFLAEQGLNPFEHIDEKGKYTTLDTADSLRETAGKDSNESMRTALKAADYSTPRTEAADIQAGANKYLSNSYNMTPTDIESVSKNIADEISALQRKYPKGMSLEDMHNERIAYGKNGKNSPVFDKTVTNSARANRAMADALSNKIEAKAPKDIGYQAYNRYIKNFYRAADYLESINGKKAPVSFGQKVIRTAAKLGMAKLFDAIPGGSVIDAVIGYQVGQALERFVENMTMPQRNAFLKDLKVSDPEAFTRVKDFLDKNAKEKADQKALPPGKPLGSPENPIIVGEPKPKGQEGPISSNAQAVSVKNPKTGKFEKAYTSEPTKTSDKMIAEKYDYDPVKKVYVPKKKK